jgi:hypothetical protein
LNKQSESAPVFLIGEENYHIAIWSGRPSYRGMGNLHVVLTYRCLRHPVWNLTDFTSEGARTISQHATREEAEAAKADLEGAANAVTASSARLNRQRGQINQ